MEEGENSSKASVASAAAASDPNDLKGCITFLVLPVVMLVDGVCLSSLWGWFLTPLGLPKIGVAHGVGLMLLRKFFTVGSTRQGSLKKDYVLSMLQVKILAMLLGYVMYRIMIRP
jgi:hypothetical protein